MNSTNQEINMPLNGWQNIGKVFTWTTGTSLSGSELILYMMIVRITVGYSQYTSEPISISNLSKLSKLSKRTIFRSLKLLFDRNYIFKVATNYNVTFDGKLPYSYQLNMKLEKFPNLGRLYSQIDSKCNNIKIDSETESEIKLDGLSATDRELAQKHNRKLAKNNQKNIVF
ncbi:MAG: hypothetical protein L3I99_01860 [Sulfurimonas sp.]|nr:hypothetical protein [Sulfurimonas sp.]